MTGRRGTTVAAVNAALKARGDTPRLRRGRGYYFFDGEAIYWFESSVMVNRVSDLTVAEWLAEYDTLKVARA